VGNQGRMGKTGPKSSDKKPPDNPWLQAGVALTIPALLVSGPLVGYGLGWLIRRWTGWGPWVDVLMLLLGLIAGARETIKVIRKIS
jgi:F0F1-type ATP synthase assembly protein I